MLIFTEDGTVYRILKKGIRKRRTWYEKRKEWKDFRRIKLSFIGCLPEEQVERIREFQENPGYMDDGTYTLDYAVDIVLEYATPRPEPDYVWHL